MSMTMHKGIDRNGPRFIVRVLDNGKKIGVYDVVDGAYHGAGPILRNVGIDYLPWLTDIEEAQRIADLLNAANGPREEAKPKSKAKSKDAEEDSLAAFGRALIADQS